MKQFNIDVDFTMSKRIAVEAESEERAKAILNGWIKYNPYEYAYSFDAYVKHEITDVNEEEPDVPEEMRKALSYVRENMDEDDMAILKAQINKCYKSHIIPNESAVDCSKVIDLLEEYGEDNNLPEGWWEEYGEIDDVLMWL